MMQSEAVVHPARSHQTEQFHRVGEEIRRRAPAVAELGGLAAQVEIVVTEEGLRIELMEDGSGELFFAFGSLDAQAAGPPRPGDHRAGASQHRNPMVVEGHTDAAPFARSGFSNWELSADRANATRRMLESAGIAPGEPPDLDSASVHHGRARPGLHDPGGRGLSRPLSRRSLR
jgi:chemotaxis protein MotB